MDIAQDVFSLLLTNQWAYFCRSLCWIAHMQMSNSISQPRRKFFGYGVLDKEATSGCAALSGIDEHAFDSPLDSTLKVGISEDDIWRFSTEFERDTFERLAGLTHHQSPGFRRTSK